MAYQSMLSFPSFLNLKSKSHGNPCLKILWLLLLTRYLVFAKSILSKYLKRKKFIVLSTVWKWLSQTLAKKWSKGSKLTRIKNQGISTQFSSKCLIICTSTSKMFIFGLKTLRGNFLSAFYLILLTSTPWMRKTTQFSSTEAN